MNPIQAVLQRVLQFAFDLVAALVRGILRAPLTAVEKAIPEIEVREAKPSEVVDVRHAVLRKGRARDTAIWDADDAEGTRHWLAEHDNKSIGIVSVMRTASPDSIPEAAYQLRGMAVLEEWQGKGVGSALLKYVHTAVGEPMWANARIKALAFYERHGWSAVSDTFEIEGIGPHRRIFIDP